MGNLSLMVPDHLYFESYLEMAAVKKSVVEYQSLDSASREKMFVNKVIYREQDVWIQKNDGTLINKRTLAGIFVPEDPGNLEAISCLCQ